MDSLISDPLTFVIYVLAIFRLALLLSKESGPMWMFKKLRRAVPAKSSAKEGIHCIWCSSVWVSTLVTSFIAVKSFWLSAPNWFIITGDTFLLMLALSAGAIIVNQQWTKTA